MGCVAGAQNSSYYQVNTSKNNLKLKNSYTCVLKLESANSTKRKGRYTFVFLKNMKRIFIENKQ